MRTEGRVRWHFHKWSRWSEPVVQPMRYVRGGREFTGHEDIQRRTCAVCNAVEERTL